MEDRQPEGDDQATRPVPAEHLGGREADRQPDGRAHDAQGEDRLPFAGGWLRDGDEGEMLPPPAAVSLALAYALEAGTVDAIGLHERPSVKDRSMSAATAKKSRRVVNE